MSLESDLKTSLQGNATLIAVVSTRTEPGPLRPEQTIPAVTWHIVTRTFEQAMNRSVAGKLTSLQFDGWGNTPQEAEEVIVALRTALIAFTTGTYDLYFTGEFEVPEPSNLPVFHRVLTADVLT